MRLVRLYEGLGFRETFRTPREETPVHVEVGLDGFTIGIAVDAAIADHGLNPTSVVGLSRSCSGRTTWTATTRAWLPRALPRSAPRTTSCPTFASRGWQTGR